MPIKKFNVQWDVDDVNRLDEAVVKFGGGRAHATRASRSTVLLEAFCAWKAPAPEAEKVRPSKRRRANKTARSTQRYDELFETLWDFWKGLFRDWSRRNDSKSEAAAAWSRLRTETLNIRDVLDALQQHVANAREERFAKHLVRLLRHRVWEGREPPMQEDEKSDAPLLFPELVDALPDSPPFALEHKRLLALWKEPAPEDFNPEEVVRLFRRTLLNGAKDWMEGPDGGDFRSNLVAAVHQQLAARDLQGPDTYAEIVEAAQSDRALAALLGATLEQHLSERLGIPNLVQLWAAMRSKGGSE